MKNTQERWRKWGNFFCIAQIVDWGQINRLSRAANEQRESFLCLKIVQTGEPVLREVARTLTSA